MSVAKAKGTAAETALVAALRTLGFPHAERRALHGGLDMGDTTGHPGLVFECKNARTVNLAKWLRETETERVNANAAFGILVVKVPGLGMPNAAQWPTIMWVRDHERLVQWAGGVRPVERPLRAIGFARAQLHLRGLQLVSFGTPCGVRIAAKGVEDKWFHYHLMSLADRCRMLVSAGYGGYATMDTNVSGIMKEHVNV